MKENTQAEKITEFLLEKQIKDFTSVKNNNNTPPAKIWQRCKNIVLQQNSERTNSMPPTK